MEVILSGLSETKQFAQLIGARLRGGEVLELTGDVGSGKTTFTKGLAEGLGVVDDVQSPSFTISRFYKGRDELELHHYDFYRLPNPGIMRYDIVESTSDSQAITVVEWAETVSDVLPPERIVLEFFHGESDEVRRLTIQYPTKQIEEVYDIWSQN